jgi:hypothetical protein
MLTELQGRVSEECLAQFDSPHRSGPRRAAVVVAVAAAALVVVVFALVKVVDSGKPADPAASPDRAWAERSETTLVSLQQQIMLTDQSVQRWSRLPAAQGAPPPEIVALLNHRATLDHLRTTVSAQLDAYRSLEQTRQRMTELPPPRRAAEQSNSESLRKTVATAEATPVVDDPAATRAQLDAVADLIRRASATANPELVPGGPVPAPPSSPDTVPLPFTVPQSPSPTLPPGTAAGPLAPGAADPGSPVPGSPLGQVPPASPDRPAPTHTPSAPPDAGSGLIPLGSSGSASSGHSTPRRPPPLSRPKAPNARAHAPHQPAATRTTPANPFPHWFDGPGITPQSSSPSSPPAAAVSPSPHGGNGPIIVYEDPNSRPDAPRSMPVNPTTPSPAAAPAASAPAIRSGGASSDAGGNSSGSVPSQDEVERATGDSELAREAASPEGQAVLRQLFGSGR